MSDLSHLLGQAMGTIGNGSTSPARTSRSAQRRAEQDALEQARHRKNLLAAQHQALLHQDRHRDGDSPAPTLERPTPQIRIVGMDRTSMCSELLGKPRASIRAQAIGPESRPKKRKWTTHFANTHQGAALPRLRRPLGELWSQLLAGVSSTYLGGGKLQSNQGANLARIINLLRSRCYLSTLQDGSPFEARDGVFVVVTPLGGESALLRELGMSRATFYRALQHPLAHHFLRSQIVLIRLENGEHRNVGTRFTVALYDPPVPLEIADHYGAGVMSEFVVQDGLSQSETSKKGPSTTTERTGGVGDNSGQNSRGAFLHGVNPFPQGDVDNQRLGTFEAVQSRKNTSVSKFGPGAGGAAADALEGLDSTVWELAGRLTVQCGDRNPQASRWLYYRALLHLGEGVVREAFEYARHREAKGKLSSNLGSYLTGMLEKRSKAQLGMPLKDLALERRAVRT